MKKIKVKKNKDLSKFEKLLFVITFVISVIVTPFSIVFSQATLSRLNYEVEQKKQKIDDQQKENDSLAMTIDELASLTKIQEVAREEGLSYNNANIKVVR